MLVNIPESRRLGDVVMLDGDIVTLERSRDAGV